MRTVGLMLVMVLASESAWACPQPPPDMEGNYHCSKYDRLYQQLQPEPVASIYVRDDKGSLPRRTKNVMTYLTKSTWHARADQGVVEALQLFDAADVPDTYELAEGAERWFIRGLDKIDHQFHVTTDSGSFLVMRCKEGGKTRTCLVRE